jgi:nitroreductase
MNDAVLHAIRTRRVVRALTDAPVGHDQLRTVLDSARYAPHAGNRRLHRYVVVTRPSLLRAVRMVSPGMLQHPTAAIAVCVDWAQVHAYGFPPGHPGPYIDVGTAGATLLLAAHSIGLAAGPVTSFSRAALATILRLPAGVRPELVICLGHAATQQPPAMRRQGGPRWDDLIQWERG